jgi:uncharacterized protein
VILIKKINVRIIPNARKTLVIEEDGRLKIYIMAPAVDGKANVALIKLLSDHFKIKKSNFKIIRGEKSRDKIIGIYED